jgi:acid stress chaperone HdeA
MTRSTMTFLAAAAAAAALLSGCSGVTNAGGDTKCKDYQSADEKTQNESITKMLKDEGKNEPANAELTATRLSITTYCQTVGKPDSTIKEAPHL